ncbi:MAG: hypothetical protein DMH00_07565 [Acidobacteria bacterium]|nr:MAG: hypothetical protein DMH00_07565 [Acidobacteriota bacterium]
MWRCPMRPITACACALVLLFAAATGSVRAQSDPAAPANDAQPPDSFPGGELRVVTGQGGGRQFPLKHTEVHAEITGSVAQVRVSQIFQNPYDRPIEAVYVFPLPRGAAVDDLEIRFGDRIIRGVIRKREEARALYDQARRSGRAAALLDQERPTSSPSRWPTSCPARKLSSASVTSISCPTNRGLTSSPSRWWSVPVSSPASRSGKRGAAGPPTRPTSPTPRESIPRS